MKNFSIILFFLLISLSVYSEIINITLEDTKNIADRTARILWGDVYPDQPSAYYGPDDEIIAYHFNYAIGKEFPDKQVLTEECQHAFENENRIKGFGTGEYANIVIGAQPYMPVIIEYSQCLAKQYALGWKIEEAARKIFGPDYQLERTYYLGLVDVWFCISRDNKKMYINLEPKINIKSAEEFHEYVNSKSYFWQSDSFDEDWIEYLENNKSVTRSTIYIPGYEEMPFLEWSYGCTPTSGAMLLGWWDNYHHYGNLIKYHMSRYDPIQDQYDHHVPDIQKDLAIEMNTDDEGSTSRDDICDGYIEEVEDRGYDCSSDGHWALTWTVEQLFDDIKEEINNNRPIHVSIENHSIIGIGYNNDSHTVDTHDPNWATIRTISRSMLEGTYWVVVSDNYGTFVDLNSPHGGLNWNNSDGDNETLDSNDFFEINWFSTNDPDTYVKLYYHYGGGYTPSDWTLITGNTENDGIFDWHVPEIDDPYYGDQSDYCRVKVEIYNSGNNMIASDGSYGNFTINPGGSLQEIISLSTVNTSTSSDYFSINNYEDTWGVVAVKDLDHGTFWYMELYDDLEFSNLIEESHEWEQVNYIVIDGYNAAIEECGVKVMNNSGDMWCNVTFDGDPETFETDFTYNFVFYPNYIANMWDVHLTPGEYYFELVLTGVSNCDLDMALFKAGGDGYFSRDNNVASSENVGPGVNEAFNYTALQEGDYGLCIISNNNCGCNLEIRIHDSSIWEGSVSTDWFDPANWLNNSVPSFDDDIIIPATSTYYPTISSGNAYCDNLTIDTGSSLALNGGYLNVYGDLDIFGQLKMQGTGATLTVENSIVWESGSSALITDDISIINCYRNWTFQAGSNVHIDHGKAVFVTDYNSYIVSDESNSYFNNVEINKPGGIFEFNLFSIADLIINGNFTIDSGSTFNSSSFNTIEIGGLFSNNGHFQLDEGTISFTGDHAYLKCNSGDYFNSIDISTSNECPLLSDLYVEADLIINSGGLLSSDYDIYLMGNWENNMGPSAFNEGTGIVIFNGADDQYCSTEEFNIIQMNKSSGEFIIPTGSTVTCDSYDWINGVLNVDGGQFTVYDLYDNSIVGLYVLTAGQIDLHQDMGHYADVNGSIIIYDGTFNIHGGADDCWFAHTDDAYLYMDGGILDVKDWGIHFDDDHLFSHVILGGTIRINGDFSSDRNDFDPEGGNIELYGSGDADIEFGPGNHLNNLIINKTEVRRSYRIENKNDNNSPNPGRRKLSENTRSEVVTLQNDLTVNGDVTLTLGTLDLNGHILNILNNLLIYGNLKMQDPADELHVAGLVNWYDGSGDNINNGNIFHSGSWSFFGGTNATLGTGNTVHFTGNTARKLYSTEPNASLGNVIINKPGSYVYISNSSSLAVHVSGDMTVSTDSEFQCGDDELTVNGELEIENQAELNMDMGGLITCNDLSADGLLEINQGEVIVHNDFLLDTNGILNLDGGSLIMDKAYTGNFMSFAGTLNLLSGYLEITNEGIQFGTGGTPNMTNGTIRVGSNFRAIQTSAFQPTGGTIEFMNTEWSTIQCNNGNFFHNLEIDKDSTLRGCMLADDLTINNDLTLTSGKLLGSGYQITIGNDVLIDSDGVLDPDDELLLVGGDWANYHGSSGFVQGSGTVRLFGGNPGIILTGETFYDLVLQKSTSPLYYTEVVPFITIHVENDCYINDGKMLLADLCTLDIDNDLILQDDTALRVSFGSTGTNIKIGRHFLDYNTDNTDYTSFIPEGSTVTFDGATNQVFESYRSSFEFGNLIINPSADYFYPHTNIIVQGNLEVLSGCWNNHTTGMTQTFMGNVAICDGGWWDNMGTVVFSGPDDAVFQRTGGSNVFLNVIIDKSSSRENRESGTLTLLSDLLCPLGGNLTVNSGTLDANGKTIGCSGDVTITGGKLALDDNSRLRVGNSKALTVSSSGIFEAIGSAGNEADVTCYNAGNYHDIIVENGGIIAAEYTIFQYLTNNGVYITESGSVNTGHVFNNCTFQNSVAGGSLLRIENSQDLISSNVNFPANTWGSSYNVYKDSDQGQLEFSLATGDFAGESYEHDPHSRIDWTGAPVIVVYPTYTLNFGDVYIGDDELRSMSIENAGGGTLLGTLTTPDGFSIAEHTRLEQIENGSRNTISYSIGSGNTTVFVITFSPLLEQTYEGDVIITHNSGGDDETVHVIGAGIQPPPPDIYIDPESLAYGEILIGQQQTLNLLIENTGGSNLVGSITTPADFSIYEWRSRDGLPFDIPAGESLYYDVLFEPTIMQVYNDNIVISHNAGSGETLVPCTGIGLAVNLTLNPSALDKTLAPGETDYEILSLGNDGNLELEYLAYIEYEETRTTIIDEGFELNFPPSGWNLESLDEWGNWIQSGSYPYNGSYCALASPMMVDDARLITPFFTATDDCILMYWIRGYEPEYYWEDAVFEIEVSTDGTNWTTLESYSQEIFIDHYVPRGLSLATYAGQNIQIAFRVQYNTSGCGVNIDNVKITGDSSPTYSWLLLDGNTSISGSIPAGNPDVEIQADFNSAGLPNGDYSAYIRFISNDTSTPCDAIPVTLIIGYYDMAITPSFLDFGEVEVGLNNTKQFTIENTGTFEIYGEITPPIGFQVWQERTNRSYPTTPFNDRDFIYYTLSPGELDSINVIFEPSDTLNYDDEIIINHNMVREPMIVQVSGSGVTLPGVLTYEIMQITTDSAVGGGQVLHDGNSTIIARGICWSKFTGPTIDDEYTSEGTGVGEFVSSLTSLDPDTPYFVRAYATNNLGTDYGNQVTFTTLPVTPTINVSVTSLADFGDVLITTFSGEQSYTVSGSNLTEDIIINSPAGFEISTTSAERTHIDKEIIDTTRDFSSQIILSPVEGSVSATTIYARFHPLTVGTYSDNIIHESIGAVSRDVAVNGTGTASELEITDVVWSDLIPYVCDEIVVDVTITNNGNASSSSCYLDLYYNLTMPPTPGEYGDKQVILSSIPAGDYDVISITQVWNDLEEIWQAYLQIDSDNAVIESDETNNVWGADLITWNLLPVIDDLTIGYNSGIIMLNWSYPIYCDSFNIYKSLDPYDFSGAVVVSTPNPYYTETGPQIKYFYLVKAVRDCVAPSITGDDQVRIKLNKGEKTKIKF